MREAEQMVLLVSPYFTPWKRLTTLMQRTIQVHGVKVLLIIRSGNDEDSKRNRKRASEWEELGVQVRTVDRLHAKVYANEKCALVTSLNLVSASVVDSWELGVWLQKPEDAALHEQLIAALRPLHDEAKDEQALLAERLRDLQPTLSLSGLVDGFALPEPTGPAVRQPAVGVAAPSGRLQPAAAGHCIRCGVGVVLNAERPLCAKCYRSWAKFKNPDYGEKYCHGCGMESGTSVARPLCRGCWRAGVAKVG